MNQQPYSPTELYRRLHTGNKTDVEFYLRAANDAASILEFGCGWGRISLPLAQAGYMVAAVDIEPEFLDELRQSAQASSCEPLLTLYQQDVTHLKLPLLDGRVQKFDRILIPYNMLYALGGASGVLQCFEHVAQHLKPEGELWFDLYDMDTFHEQYDPDDDRDDNEPVATWSHEGQQVEVFEHTEVVHDTKRLNVTYVARAASNHRAIGELAMFHDYLLSDDIEDLLTRAGFELLGRYDDPLQGEPSSANQTAKAESDETETSGPVFYCAGLAASGT